LALGCIKVNASNKSLGGALVAAVVSVIGISFLGGCLYPFLGSFWLSPSGAEAPPKYNDLNAVILLYFGFITAMIALPAALVLTYGVARPIFRLWISRGYSNVVAYISGGIIIAAIGALIMAAAHTFAGFLVYGDFRFAMLLMAVSGPVSGFVVWYVLRRSLVAKSN
jgi:hypothetical protein